MNGSRGPGKAEIGFGGICCGPRYPAAINDEQRLVCRIAKCRDRIEAAPAVENHVVDQYLPLVEVLTTGFDILELGNRHVAADAGVGSVVFE